MAFDLDDEEYRATRKLNGVDKDERELTIEEAKKILDTFTFRIKTKNYNKIDYDDIKAIKTVLSALENSVSKDEIKEIIQRIDYDVKKTREVKTERYSDYDKVRLKAYITKSNEIKGRLQELLNKGE